jgi:hypothetical protein
VPSKEKGVLVSRGLALIVLVAVGLMGAGRHFQAQILDLLAGEALSWFQRKSRHYQQRFPRFQQLIWQRKRLQTGSWTNFSYCPLFCLRTQRSHQKVLPQSAKVKWSSGRSLWGGEMSEYGGSLLKDEHLFDYDRFTHDSYKYEQGKNIL